MKQALQSSYLVKEWTPCSQDWRANVYGLNSDNRGTIHAPVIVALRGFVTCKK